MSCHKEHKEAQSFTEDFAKAAMIWRQRAKDCSGKPRASRGLKRKAWWPCASRGHAPK
jgi:hypothetical protein